MSDTFGTFFFLALFIAVFIAFIKFMLWRRRRLIRQAAQISYQAVQELKGTMPNQPSQGGFCWKCGAPLTAGAVFCTKCGTQKASAVAS